MRIITKVSGKIEGLSDKTLKLYHMYLDDFFILSFILYQNEKTFPQKLLTRKLRTFDKYFARLQEYNEVSVTGHELWKAEKENAPVVINVEIPATPEVTDVTNAASALLNTKGISAIFCSNEGTVSGLLAATSSGADLADGAAYGDLLVAGFDAGAPQKNAVRNGWFIGSVTQDPYRIGYLSIELAVKAAKGEEVEDVDTGAQWYTAENIDDPDMAMLVYD